MPPSTEFVFAPDGTPVLTTSEITIIVVVCVAVVLLAIAAVVVYLQFRPKGFDALEVNQETY